MGRRSDGTVFFFADSESIGSADESPAGQIYEEISPEYLRAFQPGAEIVAGPVTDRWGTWISALEPIRDPRTDNLIAVLGMDIAARTWKLDVAAKASPAAGIMLVLLILSGVVFFSKHQIIHEPKPILLKLLPPLAAILALLIFGWGTLFWHQYEKQVSEKVNNRIDNLDLIFHLSLKQQAAGLAASGQLIASDTAMKKALIEHDAERLLAAWKPVFETLKLESNITHLYFFDAKRICLLRVHKPEKRGDLINRFTAVEAERTGKNALGIELGPLGTFTLRSVQPIFEDDKLIGYVELGKEIEDILQTLNVRSGMRLGVTVYKKYLDRVSLKEGMRMLGREADWNRLPDQVVIYPHENHLLEPFVEWAEQVGADPAGRQTNLEIDFDGKKWRISSKPIQDASDKHVGELLVMQDISKEKAAIKRFLLLGGITLSVLLAVRNQYYVCSPSPDRPGHSVATKNSS